MKIVEFKNIIDPDEAAQVFEFLAGCSLDDAFYENLLRS